MRRPWLLFLLALGHTAAPASAPTPTPAPEDPIVAELARLRVDDEAPWRGELYSWTTARGAAALRTTRVALTATASSGTFVSPFNHLVAKLAREPGPAQAFARLLDSHPLLRFRRYAWPTPLATVMGITTHGYGHALVRLELRPEALVARLDPGAAEPVRFYDAQGKRVPERIALADPRRIGAVLHVHAGTTFRFREYVLCNESMVARWEIGTETVRARVERDRELLRALAPRLPHDGDTPSPARWSALPPAPSLLDRWSAVTAFANEAYRATPSRLRAIERELGRYDPAGPPLVQLVQAAR